MGGDSTHKGPVVARVSPWPSEALCHLGDIFCYPFTEGPPRGQEQWAGMGLRRLLEGGGPSSLEAGFWAGRGPQASPREPWEQGSLVGKGGERGLAGPVVTETPHCVFIYNHS